MVIAQKAVNNPYVEFHNRVEAGLRIGGSDLDVLGASDAIIEAATVAGNVFIDTQAFDDTDVSIRNRDGAWYLHSHEVGFDEPIHAQLMEPVKGSVEGIDIVTVPLLTHQLMHRLRKRNARKDRITDSCIGYLIHQTTLSLDYIPPANPNHTKPFLKLAWELRHRPKLDTERHSQEDGDNDRHSRSGV